MRFLNSCPTPFNSIYKASTNLKKVFLTKEVKMYMLLVALLIHQFAFLRMFVYCNHRLIM